MNIQFEIQDEDLRNSVEELSADEEEALRHSLRLATVSFVEGRALAHEEERLIEEKQASLMDEFRT